MATETTEATEPRAKGRKVSDVELIAMHDISEVIDGLTFDQAERVVAWLAARYGPGQTPGAV
jgi:hypothetical protein